MNPSPSSLKSLILKLRAWLFYAYPHHWLSAAVYGLARIEYPPVKNFLNTAFVRAFGLNMKEAEVENPRDYPTLDALFVRGITADLRPWPDGDEILAAPCDCTVSQIGSIEAGRIVQAKGQTFTVAELLGAEAPEFAHGSFATLYLSPRFCHRVFMPLSGRLLEMRHIPGRQFTVAPYAVERIPRLYARNERVVSLFEDETGAPLAVVMVGAQCVASMEMSWCGVVSPRRHAISISNYRRDKPSKIKLARGAEIGRFHLGSTVIVLSAQSSLTPATQASLGATLHYGEPLLCPDSVSEITEAD